MKLIRVRIKLSKQTAIYVDLSFFFSYSFNINL